MKRPALLGLNQGPRLATAALLAWLVGYPLLIAVGEAFGGWTSPGLGYVLEFASRATEWQALWRSLWISLASVALAAAIGVPLAFLFERVDFPGRRLVRALVALPVALPPLVGVIAFLFLYGESGFASRAVQWLLGLEAPPWRLSGPGAILLVHAYSMYVYFYLFTRAGLARLDPSLPEAAAALGAGRWRTLRQVTLPLLKPALAGAALLTFMTALGSFSAPYLFGGSFRVMTTQILASKMNGDLGIAHVESVALGLLALAALYLSQQLDARQRLTGSVRGVAPRPRPIASRAGRIGATVATCALAAFLLLPHATLLLVSFVPRGTWTIEPFPPVLSLANYANLAGGPEGLRPILNSFWMAAVATLAALVLGYAAARGSAGRQGPLARSLDWLIALPWALPATVFALSLATTFSVDAPWLGRLVLIGTPWLLPLAYLVRSLPLTGRAAMAGLRSLDPALEEAAASLGAGRVKRLFRVTLPILRPALVAGAGLAFITSLGDFVASIVLYTLDNRPISMAIDAILRRDELGLAAVYGVLLMVASTLAFLAWGGRQESV